MSGVSNSGWMKHLVADLGGHLEVFEITNLLRHSPDTPLTNPSDNLQYGATLSPASFASYTALDAMCDENPSNSFGLEVDHAVWTDEFEVEHDEVYVYFSVMRVGIEILRFDVDAAQPEDRLEWLELIQTPGEAGFLNIIEKPAVLYDQHGHIEEKVLFVGDGTAGFRIFTYAF